jgi:formamidopyrimidine-DNA glycosylase
VAIAADREQPDRGGRGNIYASEALFRAGIRQVGRQSLSREECASLVKAIRAVLSMAIRHGGTTLRDYVGAGGEPATSNRNSMSTSAPANPAASAAPQ